MSTPERPVVETHEWVSFEYDGETWIFDVTFLMSNWRCIWDQGCLGVRDHPTPDDAQGCCSFGAHFGDEADHRRVADAVARLEPDDWQFHDVDQPWADADADGELMTTSVDDACIFLNRPGFPGGHGCALHRGALRSGESILDWKPEVCWQLPVRLEYHEDENGRGVHTLRQWRRHDWGEGGAEFHWWCTEDDRAFIGDRAVYRELAEEITALVGEPVAGLVTDYLDRRGSERLLPHPVKRVPT